MQSCFDAHPTATRPAGRCRGGFTLTEMLVVIGIIILFIALAIPAISAITGTRSIAAAENNLSALVVRAREEAIALQDVRGVMFYLDPRTDGVVGMIVRPADLQNVQGLLLLDTLPNRDSLALPRGIRLQTIFDGSRSDPNNPSPNRYLGYNPVPDPNPISLVKYGGVILFDADGHLTVQQYGLQMLQPSGANSGMGDLFFPNVIPMPLSPTAFIPFGNVKNAPFSQLGIALFDRKIFANNGLFNDGDPGLDSNASTEVGEEDWIDANCTPILINRYTGALIRGE